MQNGSLMKVENIAECSRWSQFDFVMTIFFVLFYRMGVKDASLTSLWQMSVS